MKPPISVFSLVVAGLWSTVLPINAQVNVTQEHNNFSRDGLYIDSTFTPANAANLTRDLGFNGTISGNVYAQPLYVEGGPDGRAKVIVVTESNNVYALDAIDGSIIWPRNVGVAVPLNNLPCGNIDPMGITGTPVVDLASRALFLDAMTTPDGGITKKHLIYSLNVDTGATNPNWPLDVDATAVFNGTHFTSSVQSERGGLALVNGRVYVSYSGHFGDCGTYHGWVVGVDINNPANVMAWATDAIGGGIWGHGGVASDGTNMFVVTGNTFTNPGDSWSGGEAIIRLQAGPVLDDFWAPLNWQSLDQGDTDLGGCSATLIDVPGAAPSQLVLALGKDGMAYLLDRSNLGGVTTPLALENLPSAVRGQSAATYHTSQGTYFVFHTENNAVAAYKITPTNPPTIVPAWNMSQSGLGSAWVTSTDGMNNVIVWVAGAGGDQRLHAYDGDTGAVIYAGGGANEMMTGTRRWNTGIVARGRIYFAADNKVYAFAVPEGTPTPTPTATLTPTSTPTPTPTASPTATPSASPTPTAIPRVTPRPYPTPAPRPTPRADKAINIVDQDGRQVPNGVPSATSQIFDVTVGPGFQFVPNAIGINAGDTVRWTWAGSGHSVTSGTACTADGQFCSPDNTNCEAGTLSNTGTVYEHTFAQAGTYFYFCAAHCSSGMTRWIGVWPALDTAAARHSATMPDSAAVRD